MEKTCFKCGISKPLDDFYRHSEMADGHLNKCKECNKRDVKNRYYDPQFRPRIIAYEKERSQKPERKQKALEYQKLSRKRNNHSRARAVVGRAVRSGLLIKMPCEKCGTSKVEAHHPDHSKPLEVMWLCRRHHMLEEGKVPF